MQIKFLQNYTLVSRTDFEIMFHDIKELSVEYVFAPLSPYTELRIMSSTRADDSHAWIITHYGSRTMDENANKALT